jgi:hypothetical protein
MKHQRQSSPGSIDLHDGLTDGLEVPGRVLVLRAVATADVATGQAQAKVVPSYRCELQGIPHSRRYLA